MNTPRTDLEELVGRLVAKAAVCQEFVDAELEIPPEHIDELLAGILNHGKALSEALEDSRVLELLLLGGHVIRDRVDVARQVVRYTQPPPPTSAKGSET